MPNVRYAMMGLALACCGISAQAAGQEANGEVVSGIGDTIAWNRNAEGRIEFTSEYIEAEDRSVGGYQVVMVRNADGSRTPIFVRFTQFILTPKRSNFRATTADGSVFEVLEVANETTDNCADSDECVRSETLAIIPPQELLVALVNSGVESLPIRLTATPGDQVIEMNIDMDHFLSVFDVFNGWGN